MICRWYITAAAVRQYMVIQGRHGDGDSPAFFRAERDLAQSAEQARLARDVDGRTRTQLWRVSWPVRGQTVRLELVVSIDSRPEGPLPALIAVRAKRRGGAKHRPVGSA